MGVMKLPTDFNLIDPKKNLNHICQNVPVTTAEDMAYNIKNNNHMLVNFDNLIPEFSNNVNALALILSSKS